MDDVWVVIGLLLFGSLLFCLCCYKVTNLLYMLYHIDDATESLTGNDIAASTAAAAAHAAAVGNNSVATMGLPLALALVDKTVNSFSRYSINKWSTAIVLGHRGIIVKNEREIRHNTVKILLNNTVRYCQAKLKV